MTTSRSSLALLALLAGGSAAAQEVALPSGATARLYDVVLEVAGAETRAPDAFTDPEADRPAAATPGGPDGVARFRLSVEGLGRPGLAYGDVGPDLGWLCATMALPALAANGWAPAEVVIALSDREVAFGTADADAVQFIEGFRVEAGACIPQAF